MYGGQGVDPSLQSRRDLMACARIQSQSGPGIAHAGTHQRIAQRHSPGLYQKIELRTACIAVVAAERSSDHGLAQADSRVGAVGIEGDQSGTY